MYFVLWPSDYRGAPTRTGTLCLMRGIKARVYTHWEYARRTFQRAFCRIAGRAPVASARPCAGRFRRGDGGDRRRGTQGALLHARRAARRWLLCTRVSGGGGRSLDGRPHSCMRLLRGVPQSIVYDNDRCLVSKILADGTRQCAVLFSGFLSHYLIT